MNRTTTIRLKMPKQQSQVVQITRFFRSSTSPFPSSPAPRKYNPQNPCPELLGTNYPVTESQLREVRALVDRTKEELLRTEDEVARLQFALQTLRKARATNRGPDASLDETSVADSWLGFG
ncbi:hypothetical protein MKEN_00544700 [Mycena kentingensis (nom. inval.)]|nr:hypothetical protein MKEN_00544700 [Mycena kentingensis (nom. inval.)]